MQELSGMLTDFQPCVASLLQTLVPSFHKLLLKPPNLFIAQAVRRSTIFVDDFDALRSEGGDVMIPFRAGVINDSSFASDLTGLTRGTHPGRRLAEEITLFKSVGLALEDLACAKLLWEKSSEQLLT